MQRDGEMSVYGGSWRRGAGSESDEQTRQLQGLQETENEYTAEKKVIDRGEGMVGIERRRSGRRRRRGRDMELALL